MSIGMLVKGEVMKGTRRVGARVAVLAFFGICLLSFASVLYQMRRNPGNPALTFPRIWSQLLQPFASISIFLAAIVVIMLTASEFMWRTSRQNVIDGLSKDQWFVAKLLNALLVCVLFALILLVTGAAFAAPHPFTTFMRAEDAQMLGAYLLGVLGIGSMAFFLAMLLRKDGAALGLLLAWATIGEALIQLLLMKWHDGWEKYARYLPFRLFFGIFEPRLWDPVRRQQVAEIMKKMHRPPPDMPNVTLLLSLAVLYIIGFIGFSYWNYSKRDL